MTVGLEGPWTTHFHHFDFHTGHLSGHHQPQKAPIHSFNEMQNMSEQNNSDQPQRKKQRVAESLMSTKTSQSMSLRPMNQSSFYPCMSSQPLVHNVSKSIIRSMPTSGVAPYRDFALQREAFEFVDSSSEALRRILLVFAEEIGEGGKRRYIVTTKERLLERLLDTPPAQRHFYEIIRDQRPSRSSLF